MIQVIHRSVDIMEFVAEEAGRPKLLSNIAQGLNLNPATCANIIKTLVDRGLLKKADNMKGYLIGDRFMEIGNGTLGFKKLLSKAVPILDLLSDELQENCLIAILKRDKRQIILNKKSNQLIQATTPEEKLAYDSSTGRLMIAYLDDKEIDIYLKIYGLPAKEIWPGASSRTGFLKHVAKIREMGYALIEDTVQVVGIATPIYRDKKVIASLSIYMPAFRFTDRIREQMLFRAVETAKLLSA
jgi:IclR family KDG regulon transcriptional repressor